MSFRLLVGNVPVEAKEDALKEIFSSQGSVVAVTIPKNEAGRARGFAFVEMSSRKEAVAAQAALSNCEYLGRKLTVSLKEASVVNSPGIFSWFKLFKV